MKKLEKSNAKNYKDALLLLKALDKVANDTYKASNYLALTQLLKQYEATEGKTKSVDVNLGRLTLRQTQSTAKQEIEKLEKSIANDKEKLAYMKSLDKDAIVYTSTTMVATTNDKAMKEAKDLLKEVIATINNATLTNNFNKQ
jgi:hypothetical protein